MSGPEQDHRNAETENNLKRPKDNQFKRLSKSSTISFAAKAAHDDIVKKDSLDFSLNSIYDHHFQWWAPKPFTVLQNSTNFGDQKRKESRIDSNNIRNESSYSITKQELKSSPKEYRNDPNHVNVGVLSSHLSNSRRGFGRSMDGLFYNL